MINRRALYSTFDLQSYFIKQKIIIDKIRNGLFQNKKRWEQSLTEEDQRKLQNEHDGRGIDVDWAFGGMEIVDKIADIFKEIEKKELQEAILFPAGYNIQQFLEDIEKLNKLKLLDICDRCNLFHRIDDFFKYLSEKENSDIKGLKDRIECQKQKYKNNKREYEELIKKGSKIKGLIELGYNNQEELVQLIENISKEELFQKPTIRKIFCSAPDTPEKRMEIFEDSMKKYRLEHRRLQMKKLEDEINNEEEEFEKVRKIHDLKKRHTEPIKEERIKQYDDLRAVLLRLNTQSLQQLERYYKFKEYEKYLSDRALYTLRDLLKIENELVSIELI